MNIGREIKKGQQRPAKGKEAAQWGPKCSGIRFKRFDHIHKRWILFLLLVSCVYISPLLANNDNISWDNEAVAENEAIIRAEIEKIKKELEQTKNHPWAGEYYQGDGLGANLTFVLAPHSGFAYTWYGCLGLYNQNYGNISWDNTRLKLQFALENDEKRNFALHSEYLPVRWGKRLYLIAADEVIKFCNDINAGFEPRNSTYGFVFLRKEDWKKKVEGKPELPEKYQPYLLENPIEATIISVSKVEKLEHGLEIATVVIDKGKDAGLLPGMKLHITDSGSSDSLVLTKVEPTQSTGRSHIYSTKPRTGNKVSTQPQGRKELKK